MPEINKSSEIQEPPEVAQAMDALMQQIATDPDENRFKPDFFPANQYEELEKRVYIDTLTGVGTKLALDEYMEGLTHNQTRNVGFLFVDGNEFKQINDQLSYGHGNNFIQRTGHMLTEHTDQKTTKVFRWAGDEFVLIFEHIPSGKQLDTAGSRLVELFCGGNEKVGKAVIPTVAIGGVFIGSESGQDELESALVHAEMEMKAAKQTMKQEIGPHSGKQVKTEFHKNDNTEVSLFFSPSSYVRTPNLPLPHPAPVG